MNPWGAPNQMQNSMGGDPSQMQQPAPPAQGGSYPTMQNAYGLGDQAVRGNPSAPGFQAQPLNSVMPDSGSRGFNPWSLQGEAISRGR